MPQALGQQAAQKQAWPETGLGQPQASFTAVPVATTIIIESLAPMAS
jgi:hypothetical protein